MKAVVLYVWIRIGLDIRIAVGKKNLCLAIIVYFYFSFLGSAAKHDQRCMQFAHSASKFACSAQVGINQI